MKKKRIVVSVISDLVTDQRVHKVCMYLHEKGYAVTLIGRRFKQSAPMEKRTYNTERILCHFKKGVAQYAEFNFKLFLKLMCQKTDLLLANDMDTLVPNYIHAKIRNKKLVYDSHEYFTGTPELQQKPMKRKFWKLLERLLLPRIQYAYTVNASIAELYKKEYGIQMKVLRNVPLCKQPPDKVSGQPFPPYKFILLLQGAGINKDRGAEELIESMLFLPKQFLLVFIGSGDAWEALQHRAAALGLSERIQFISKVPFTKLRAYTKQAHIGLSLDKPTCLNYELSLPNKVFDYIHAGIPVLASGVTEVKRVIETYQVGRYVPEITPKAIAEIVLEMYEAKEQYALWKKNAIRAATELCWENEQQVLNEIYND